MVSTETKKAILNTLTPHYVQPERYNQPINMYFDADIFDAIEAGYNFGYSAGSADGYNGGYSLGFTAGSLSGSVALPNN